VDLAPFSIFSKENDAAKPTPTDILVKETVVSNTVQKENDVARPALTLDFGASQPTPGQTERPLTDSESQSESESEMDTTHLEEYNAAIGDLKRRFKIAKRKGLYGGDVPRTPKSKKSREKKK